jgi:hypothetical protein
MRAKKEEPVFKMLKIFVFFAKESEWPVDGGLLQCDCHAIPL